VLKYNKNKILDCPNIEEEKIMALNKLRGRCEKMNKLFKIKSKLILILFLAFNFTLGAWSTDVILSWFGKDIPLFWDGIIGIFSAELTLPIAIIGEILKMLNVF